MRKAISVKEWRDPTVPEVVEDATHSEREILIPIGYASPTTVNQASDLDFTGRTTAQDDIRKTKIAVGKDEVLIGRDGREKLIQQIGRSAPCADLIEVILAHAAGGDSMASCIHLSSDPLVERAIDGARSMEER